jgi:hypothetical protein
MYTLHRSKQLINTSTAAARTIGFLLEPKRIYNAPFFEYCTICRAKLPEPHKFDAHRCLSLLIFPDFFFLAHSTEQYGFK